MDELNIFQGSVSFPEIYFRRKIDEPPKVAILARNGLEISSSILLVSVGIDNFPAPRLICILLVMASQGLNRLMPSSCFYVVEID